MKDEQRVYIKGNQDRGKEIIKLLKDLGGRNTSYLKGTNKDSYYFIDPYGVINAASPTVAGAFPYIREFYKEISLPRWKPKSGESYYFLDDRGKIMQSKWNNTQTDDCRYEFSNCFKTAEEAGEAINKIKEVLNN